MAYGAATCKICLHDERDAIEEVALRATLGEMSWRAVAKEAGLSHHQSLQNHMQKHYVAPVAPQVQALTAPDTNDLMADSIQELKEQMRIAPPEVKPLYAVAIKNLAGLNETKPSQQHLIQALKSIHEITGMRMEQRMMLQFAEQMFGEVGAAPAAALDSGIIDAEVIS